MFTIRFAFFTLVSLILIGCSDGGNGKSSSNAPASTDNLPADLFVTAKIDGAKSVSEIKKDAKEGDQVIIRGVVGGAVDPFVANRAMVSVIDYAVVSCKDNGEECPTPWDYCCTPQDELTKGRATIQVAGKDGSPLKVAISAGQKIKPYDVIIVRGKVGPRPSPEVLVVTADAIHVEGAKN